MVCADQLDGLAQDLATEVVNRHLHGDRTVLALHVGVQAGHIGDETDLHLFLGLGQGAGQTGHGQHA
ncbi:hypothetical protein SDC9_199393 [bioreactor metagenome]|uniref:Uncharacterized protein n=1 Tax=bioreactor metagenome TaxID=1076179 RepID=A0A645ITM3_9ZZZZ